MTKHPKASGERPLTAAALCFLRCGRCAWRHPVLRMVCGYDVCCGPAHSGGPHRLLRDPEQRREVCRYSALRLQRSLRPPRGPIAALCEAEANEYSSLGAEAPRPLWLILRLVLHPLCCYQECRTVQMRSLRFVLVLTCTTRLRFFLGFLVLFPHKHKHRQSLARDRAQHEHMVWYCVA